MNPQKILQPRKGYAESALVFWDKNGSPHLDQTIGPIGSEQKQKKKKEKRKKEFPCLENFAVPTDYRVKIKENETTHKYLDLPGDKKKTKQTAEW